MSAPRSPERLSVRDPVEEALAYTTPARFAAAFFRFRPFPYQEDVMDAVLLQGKTRIAWLAGRRVGKTATTANIALQKAVREPGTEVAIFAPSFDQARNLSDEIRHQLAGSPFQSYVSMDTRRELRLRFGVDEDGKPIESVIYTFSLAGKVRGKGADMLIFDESAFCDPEDYNSKALPFIADRPDAVIIHISTIWADDDHFMQAYRDYAQRPKGASFRTPTTMRPDTGAMLKELRETMDAAAFHREYLCELIAEDGVFNQRAVQACLTDLELKSLPDLPTIEPKRGHDYHVGVDWGKQQDQTVIAVVEQNTQDHHNPVRLVFLQIYPPNPDNPRHYTTILGDVQNVAKQYRAKRVFADAGEGGHQAEVLEKALGSKVFESVRYTRRNVNWLIDHSRVLVERRAVELPRTPEAVQKALLGVFRVDDGYNHVTRQGKDIFDAIALALKGIDEANPGKPKPPMNLFSGLPGGRAHGLRYRSRAYDASKKDRLPDPDGLSREIRRYLRMEQEARARQAQEEERRRRERGTAG